MAVIVITLVSRRQQCFCPKLPHIGICYIFIFTSRDVLYRWWASYQLKPWILSRRNSQGWPRYKYWRNNGFHLPHLKSRLFLPFSVFKCFLYTKCHGSVHLKIKDYRVRSRFESAHSWQKTEITINSPTFHYSGRTRSENTRRKKYAQDLTYWFVVLCFPG